MDQNKDNIPQDMKDLSLSLVMGHMERVETILAHCRIEDVNESGAMVMAVLSKHSDVLPQMLKAGADPNVVLPNTQYTPLMAAVHKNHTNHDQIETVKLLLDAGADPYAKDKQGRDILDIAQKTYEEQRNDGSKAMVDFLKTVMPNKKRSYKSEQTAHRQQNLRRYLRNKRPGA